MLVSTAMPRSRLVIATAAAVLSAGACSRPESRAASGDGDSSAARGESAAGAVAAAPCQGDNGGITLPDGFCATVFADSLGASRHLVVAENGDVFVNVQSGRRGGGNPGIVALRDTNRDGRADVVERFGKRGGTGIALHDGWLYQDVGDAIVRWPVKAGSLTPSGAEETILTGLPTTGHGAHSIVLDGGTLYVNVGSETNSCQESDRQNASPGHDPCTELRTRAGIWKYDAGRTGQRFATDARFATGIRNAVGMDMGPGGLWAMQHGRDQLAQNWSKLFTNEQGAELPAEELLQVNQGDDFGWPYCYYDGQKKQLVLAPEYGGDGTKVGRCADKKGPALAFPAHWAPNGLMFYDGSMFPAKYRGGAFIAFHGSWNRAPLPQEGYRVVFAPFTGGRPAGAYETFAQATSDAAASATDGAASTSQSRQPRLRATGLAQAPDGSLFITDDARGRIWRVTWGGNK
ncbi:MAG TPA: PQQ-dependent sugar dehydrogenase [Gemmatimonadaceae bacterium]|nr:PQQ-dependent sugar dehydrogenase [Gemmatimonadaceae bacterium]